MRTIVGVGSHPDDCQEFKVLFLSLLYVSLQYLSLGVAGLERPTSTCLILARAAHPVGGQSQHHYDCVGALAPPVNLSLSPPMGSSTVVYVGRCWPTSIPLQMGSNHTETAELPSMVSMWMVWASPMAISPESTFGRWHLAWEREHHPTVVLVPVMVC